MKSTIMGYASKEDMCKLVDQQEKGKELETIFVWNKISTCHDYTVTITFSKKAPPLLHTIKTKLKRIWKIILE